MARSRIAAAAVSLAAVLMAARADFARAADGPFTSTVADFLNDAAIRGFRLSLVYDGEGFVNADGGNRTGAVYLGVLHLRLRLDGERLLHIPGLTAFFEGMAIHGGHPSDLVGDAQGVSNLEAPSERKLYEAWLQENACGNRVSALFGLYDLSTEFYRLQSASLFLNSSFGTGPEFAQSGHGGPSIYPNTAVGGRLAFKPARGVILRAAILDGTPVDRPDGERRVFAEGDGLLVVAEAAFLSRPAPEDHPVSGRFRIGRGPGLRPYDDKVAVGGWYYTATFEDLSERDPAGRPLSHSGSGGAYALADGLLFRSAASPRRELTAFLELGLGDSRVNRFGYYGGGGLAFSGLLSALANDELGLAVAIARNGSHFIEMQRENAIPVTGTETAVELTYLLQIGQHFALQPDLQYVMRAGTDPTRENALAVALRFELSY